MSEVLHRTIIEEETNFPLYQFLLSNIKALNANSFDANFHIKFLLELSLFLGFYPLLSNHKSNTLFNLEDGIFEHENSGSPMHLNKETSETLANILLNGVNASIINNRNRFMVLDGLVTYYEVQTGLKPGTFQSHEILKTVFS